MLIFHKQQQPHQKKKKRIRRGVKRDATKGLCEMQKSSFALKIRINFEKIYLHLEMNEEQTNAFRISKMNIQLRLELENY